jgi:CTP:molybdopterin cytidylyltransferase MocA
MLPVITCILLAAGFSERFGSPKALASFRGRTVIEHIQQTLLGTSCDEIVIVLGAHADQIRPSIFIHSRIRVVYNKDHYFGQTSSVQTGWRELQNSAEGAFFLPVDCPLVLSSSIDRIIDHFKKYQPDILIPAYQQKKGHPPLFHARLGQEIMGLPMSLGLNFLFGLHPPQTIEINDAGIIKSFNTKEEFEAISRQ